MPARAQLPMPKVYLMDEAQPNAFATGRNPENAAVAVTTGLLERLSREEVAGVVAHELAHIKNHDTLIMTITATIAGAISMLAQFGMFFGGNRDSNSGGGGMGIIGTLAMVILAPIAAMLVQMAISRTREYSADKLGAQIAGQPVWLAAALAKIANAAHAIPNDHAERNPATAHMFIINPLSGERMDNLFSTHPATENRIAALEKLAREMGQGGFGGDGYSGGGGPSGGGGSYAGAAPRASGSVPASGPWSGASPRRRSSRRSLGAVGSRHSEKYRPIKPLTNKAAAGASRPPLLSSSLEGVGDAESAAAAKVIRLIPRALRMQCLSTERAAHLSIEDEAHNLPRVVSTPSGTA